MLEKVAIPESDYELVQTMIDHKSELMQAHSRLRADFVKTELSVINKLGVLDKEIQSLVELLAKRLGIESLEGWSLQFNDMAFVREVPDPEPEPLVEPELESELNQEVVQPAPVKKEDLLEILRKKYKK